VNGGYVFFGSVIGSYWEVYYFMTATLFIETLFCILGIMVAIIFLKTEDTLELISVLPRKSGLFNMLLPPFGHILSNS